MAIRKILQEPDPILRQISQPVETVGIEEQQLMDDMVETMYDAPGIGLAAIQIGVPKNIIVMDISRKKENKNPMYFVNPIIKNKSEEMSRSDEGCLSLKNVFVEVDRPSTCEVEYLDYNGEKRNLKCNGLLATCIQHEYEHLLGVLMVDHLSKLKKTMIIKKLSKQKSKAERIVI